MRRHDPEPAGSQRADGRHPICDVLQGDEPGKGSAEALPEKYRKDRLLCEESVPHSGGRGLAVWREWKLAEFPAGALFYPGMERLQVQNTGWRWCLPIAKEYADFDEAVQLPRMREAVERTRNMEEPEAISAAALTEKPIS